MSFLGGVETDSGEGEGKGNGRNIVHHATVLVTTAYRAEMDLVPRGFYEWGLYVQGKLNMLKC